MIEKPAHLDPALLSRLAEEMAAADPIDWTDLGIEPRLVYDMMAGQVAELFSGYAEQGLSAEEQLRLALPALVKLNVETFALALRRERDGG